VDKVPVEEDTGLAVALLAHTQSVSPVPSSRTIHYAESRMI
jgi:hypothetical protein